MTMNVKHTPGPWLFRTAPTSAGLCHIVSAADWKGAFIYGDGIRKGVDDALPKAQELAANARLIAAAPELLEALRDLVDVMTGRIDGEIVALHNALGVIAKATGENQ